MLTKYSFLKVRLLFLMLRKGKLTIRKIFNTARCYAAYRFKLDRSGRTPVVINFELSNHCNENCVFCRSEKGEIPDLNPGNAGQIIPKGTMKFEIVESILLQTKDTLLMAVPYVNGEPFIYQRLDEVLRVARECNVATMISSNGVLLSQENINKIIEHDLDFLKVHVSGFTADIHRIQHRVGNVEEIKSNLRLLLKSIRARNADLLVLIDYILYKHNAHQVEQFKAFAHDLGFLFSVRPGNPLGMEGQEDAQPVQFPSAQNTPCDWLWKVLTVNWNGDLLPCCDYVVYGNAKGYGSFKEHETDVLGVWNGPRVVQMRKTHREQGRKPIPICSKGNRVGVEFKY